MSHVMCHMYLFFLFFFGQNGESYWELVCYQRGLPRLVLNSLGPQVTLTNISLFLLSF